jgi:3-deoxy-D-manno-octulosonate 8-phosphate phosphatase (KDO 8-P phosphatase)
MKDILERAARTKRVLTDGSLFFGDDGQEYKAFNSRDGHGTKMLMKYGVEIGIITGRTSHVVEHRMKNLGVTHIYQGKLEKIPAYEELVAKLGVTDDEVAYVGDDVVDLPVMRRVGLAIAVQDAHPLVLKHCHWQTPSGGGRGAARDVCEMIMEAKGVLDKEMSHYL